jgi:hypothetical protein
MDGRQIINRKRLEETIGSYMLAWSALEADFPKSLILDLKGRPLPFDVCIQKKATTAEQIGKATYVILGVLRYNDPMRHYVELQKEYPFSIGGIESSITMSFGYSEWDNADLVPVKDNLILGYYKDLSPELMEDLTNLLKEHRDHYVR